jgi:hypothetical protein
MKNLFYYNLETAEDFKKKYNSWIGKHAHVGRGLKDTLRAIQIKEKRSKKSLNGSVKLYRVDFEFETGGKFSAREFLFYNGLMHVV